VKLSHAVVMITSTACVIGATMLNSIEPPGPWHEETSSQRVSSAPPDMLPVSSPDSPFAGEPTLDTSLTSKRSAEQTWEIQRATTQGQEDLFFAAQRLRIVAGDQYSEIVFGAEGEPLRLYVKGAPSEELRAAVVKEGLPVSLTEASFTESEAKAEIARLISMTDLMERNKITGAYPSSSRNALVFEVGVERAPASAGPRISNTMGFLVPDETVAAAELELQANSALEIEVDATVDDLDRIPALRRWDDSNPFYGGNLIRRAGADCTSAFAARFRDTGRLTLLSARHCGEGNWASPQGAQLAIGTTVHRWDTLALSTDAMGITATLPPVATGPYAGRMYYGANNSPLSVNVFGFAQPYVGLRVCGGGGYTGSVCGQQVTRINFAPVGYPWGGSATFFELDQDGGATIGQGDSGGPVYFPSSSGAIGIGITSYIRAPFTACQGVIFEGRQCSELSGAVQVWDVLNSRNMELVGSSFRSFQNGRGPITPG